MQRFGKSPSQRTKLKEFPSLDLAGEIPNVGRQLSFYTNKKKMPTKQKLEYMGVSKKKGVAPKMDGENHGKPY